MKVPPDQGKDGEEEIHIPRGERRHVAALARRVDAVAKEVGRARADVGGVAHDLQALRQDVHALRAGVEELLRRARPGEVMLPQPPAHPGVAAPRPVAAPVTRRTEVVYLGAGLAVAVIAVLLSIYLFTGT